MKFSYEFDFNRKDVGEVIRDYRENILKISVDKLAERLNCNSEYIKQCEKGVNSNAIHLLNKIAKYYKLKFTLTLKN